MANFVEIDATLINLDQITHIETYSDDYKRGYYSPVYNLYFYHGEDVILEFEFEGDDAWKECDEMYKEWKKKLIGMNNSEVSKNECKFCKDEEQIVSETVCYIPTENGSSIDIPVRHCPNCGRILREEGE